MSNEEMYIQCIYSVVKNAVEDFNKKVQKRLEPKPPKDKKKAVYKVKHGKAFVSFFQKESEIPDEYFTRFFDIQVLEPYMTAEVQRYEELLGIEYTEGTFDIRDLVSNPKANRMTYIEALNRLYDKTDSIDYYERTFRIHMANLKRNWLQFNNKQMCLWGSTFRKIGDKFYIANSNGSHLTCICKLMQISGLPDEYFDMPEGFIESLGQVKTCYKNTPDNLEFVLMFNRMYEIMKKSYPSVKFYLKDAKTKGQNVVGIVGTDVEFSSALDIVEFLKARSFLVVRDCSLDKAREGKVACLKAVGEK